MHKMKEMNGANTWKEIEVLMDVVVKLFGVLSQVYLYALWPYALDICVLYRCQRFDAAIIQKNQENIYKEG